MPVLRRGLLGTALLLTLVAALATPALLSGASAARVQPSPTASAAAAGFGPAVLAELNRIRARSGLPTVGIDRRMSRTASAHSRDMARRGYFGHGSWGSRVAQASGSASAVGEVLGWLQRKSPRSEAREIVRGWLNSPPHRQVLLDGQFRRIGIGRARGSLGGVRAAIYTVDWASAR